MAVRPHWTITVDHHADPNAKPGTNANAIGIVGPSKATLTHEEIVNHPEAKKFRMFDDDGELYYEGVAVNCDFEPKDNFGEPNAGCTSIQYFENGKWQEL